MNLHTHASAAPLAIRQKLPFWLLAVILLAIFAARVIGLVVTAADLTHDEAQYWAWSREFAFGYYNKPPMVAWMIRAATMLCGDGEVCIRLPSPVLHTASAFLIYGLASLIYGHRIGFWSAIVYATLPGISVSSVMFTTDAALLFFWIMALIALYAHIQQPRVSTGIALGVAIGLGLNAKYAMIYLVGCSALYIAMTPDARRLLRSSGTWIALLLAALLILPNILWNASHGFATYMHTSDNIGWRGSFFNPDNAFGFLRSQVGILGPILFVMLGFLLVTGRRTSRPAADRLLLYLSIPIIAVMTIQGLLFRAHGNWAATAYPAAAILVTAFLIEGGYRRLFAVSLALHAVIAAGIIAIGIFADDLKDLPGMRKYRRLLGWESFSQQLETLVKPTGINTVVSVGRPLTAQLVYYLRHKDLIVRAYAVRGEIPEDQFQLKIPWYYGGAAPVVLVTPVDPSRLAIPAGKAVEIGSIKTDVFVTRGKPMRIYRIDPPAP